LHDRTDIIEEAAVLFASAARSAKLFELEIACCYAQRAISLVTREGITGSNYGATHCFEGAISPWQARKLQSYIDSRLAFPIRIRELAGLLGMSNSRFARAFSQRFGVSTHVFITARRIRSAKRSSTLH
jgi:hypothetical protein